MSELIHTVMGVDGWKQHDRADQ